MNKKIIIALVVIVIILVVAILVVKEVKGDKINTTSDNDKYSQLTDDERVIEETKVIELDKPDFTDRSGFELVQSGDLNIQYGKIYSQDVNQGQVDFNYKDHSFTLIISKTQMYTNVSDEPPTVYLLADVDVTCVPQDDEFYDYYYQKNNMYYLISTTSDVERSDIEELVRCFDIKMGDNN